MPYYRAERGFKQQMRQREQDTETVRAFMEMAQEAREKEWHEEDREQEEKKQEEEYYWYELEKLPQIIEVELEVLFKKYPEALSPQRSQSEKVWAEVFEKSLFSDFLFALRKEGEIKISIPEWINFLTLVKKYLSREKLSAEARRSQIFTTLKMLAKISLIKDKTNEAVFDEIFNKHFSGIIEKIKKELDSKEKNKGDKDEKESLGTQEVIDEPAQSGAEEETIHGGKEDQHNDILRQEDKTKEGGGESQENKNKKKEVHSSAKNALTDGKTEKTKKERKKKGQGPIITRAETPLDYGQTDERIEERKKRYDKRDRYEKRPSRENLRETIAKLRYIISTISQTKTKKLDIKRTVKKFARHDYHPEYKRELEEQPKIVLFIDVGGPVDYWSPLIKTLSEEMSRGLAKLEIYLFHNNLYGYVWKADSKNPAESLYAKPNSLLNIKKIVNKKKKVIIYGDAKMSYSELNWDGWSPQKNDKRLKNFSVRGTDCLNFIKKKAGSAVWINPFFKSEWEEGDKTPYSLESIARIIDMYDLSIGGVEDAVKKLVTK